MPPKLDISVLKIRFLMAIEKFKCTKPEFKYICAAFVFGYLLTYITPIYEFLSLSSSQLFNFQVWKLLTSSFIEPNILLIVFQTVVAYHFLYLIEPVWGRGESLKFIAILQLITPLFIAAFALLEFIIFGSFYFYYYGRINGMVPIGCGVLVAIKQFLPDVVLFTTPFGRIKNNHLPAISFSSSFILWISGLVRSTVILQSMIGIQISWTYLRFYQLHKDTNEVGDPSEHLDWATLFPRRLQGVAGIIGKYTFQILVNIKICKHVEYTGFEQFEPMSTDVVLPTTEAKDTERRRQKALRDLNERLGRTAQTTDLTEIVSVPNYPVPRTTENVDVNLTNQT